MLPLRGQALGALVLGWRFELEPAPAHVELGERLADFATTLVDRSETAHERDLLIAHAPVVLAAIDADGVVTVCAGAAAERIGLGDRTWSAAATARRSRTRPRSSPRSSGARRRADRDARPACAGASSTCG